MANNTAKGYDPYIDIKGVYDAKVGWNNATTDEERKKYEDAANASRKRLLDNGRFDIANQISSEGATAEATKKILDQYSPVKPNTFLNNGTFSRQFVNNYLKNNSNQNNVVEQNNAQVDVATDKMKKLGKTATRDYFYSLGQSRGMTKEDVDKLISWDNDTGEVTFGGKKIGVPDAVVDGVSYWSDTSVLDNAFNDYLQRTSSLEDKNNYGINTKIEQNWGTIQKDKEKYDSEHDKIFDYANQDITKTDEYKSAFDNIMPAYDLKAMQGRQNQLASGASSNGGNIDSYAAANALRQQAALTAQGQQLAHQIGLESHNARVNNVRNILSDLGVYQRDSWNAMGNVINQQQMEASRIFDNNTTKSQQEFENKQTALNNKAARDEVYSNISGVVGDSITKTQSDLWNEDGSLKNPNYNFWQDIEGLRKIYDASTDENERAKLWEQMRLLELARNQKIDESGSTEYKTYAYQDRPKTFASTSLDKQLKTSEVIANTEADANKFGYEQQAKADIYGYNAQLQANKYTADMNYKTETDVANIAADSALAQLREEVAAAAAQNDAYAFGLGQIDALLSVFKRVNTGPRDFINNVLVPEMEKYEGGAIPPAIIESLIAANTVQYNIDVEDAQLISNAFDSTYDWSTEWTDNEDGTDDETKKDGDKTVIVKKGSYRGMKKK